MTATVVVGIHVCYFVICPISHLYTVHVYQCPYEVHIVHDVFHPQDLNFGIMF